MNLTWIKDITGKQAVRDATAATDGVKLILIIQRQILNWKVPISASHADPVISKRGKTGS
jgi:hypothetical protein